MPLRRQSLSFVLPQRRGMQSAARGSIDTRDAQLAQAERAPASRRRRPAPLWVAAQARPLARAQLVAAAVQPAVRSAVWPAVVAGRRASLELAEPRQVEEPRPWAQAQAQSLVLVQADLQQVGELRARQAQ